MTAADGKSGPYVSDDGREFWLLVSDYTYTEALKEAASWARQLIDDSGRSRYTGRKEASVHDH